MLTQEHLEFILNPKNESRFYQSKDQVRYSKYKKGEPYYEGDNSALIKSYELDMKILSLLEGLGYPMEELGTFLYKELIHEVCSEIKDMSTREDVEKCKSLMEELSEPFSSIYHLVAREYLDIGIKTFHKEIGKALDKIDSRKIDESLALKVYGSNPDSLDYGKQALLFAGYVLGRFSKSYKVPKTKKLKIETM